MLSKIPILAVTQHSAFYISEIALDLASLRQPILPKLTITIERTTEASHPNSIKEPPFREAVVPPALQAVGILSSPPLSSQ